MTRLSPVRKAGRREKSMPSEDVRILVVDDEREIRRMLKTALSAYGYDIREAPSGHDGLSEAQLFHPDVVILDLGLPDLDGIEVIRALRQWTKVPIIVLTVREDEQDKIEALDAGADDYVTKPFSMGELLARIRVVLRYAAKSVDEPLVTLGKLKVDLAGRHVTLGEVEVKLTPPEYEILKSLVLHAGKIVTHQELLRVIPGSGQKDVHYLRVYIGQLRHKVEEDPSRPRYVVTEPGVGYRFGAVS
jgi:two-component system, OmpR family, KDP operon response regulator KdpE